MCVLLVRFLLVGFCFLPSIQGKDKEQELSNREMALETVRKNFAKLREKMRAVEDEYTRKGINLDSVKGVRPITSPPPPSELAESEIMVENYPKQTFSQNNEISIPSKNILGFYLGPLVPEETEFSNQNGNFMVKYETGINLRAEYRRLLKNLSWGIGLDTKFFNSKKIEIPQFGTVASGGTNLLLSPFLSLGWEHAINEDFFFKADGSLGYSVSRKNLVIDNDDLSDTLDSSYYYGVMLGAGRKWSTYYRGMIFYRIDQIGEAGNFSDQLFQQLGIELSVEY